ncbi:MAG: S1 RNA-binding domain-containing protein [Minisyncoccales bacterium]
MEKELENTLMDNLVAESPNPPKEGDMVEGTVVAIDKSSIYIDLPPFGTGIIYGREYIMARDIVRKIHVGDSVTAKVVDTKNEDGYIELSLKEAKQALIWGEVEEAIKKKTPLELVVQDANKGGLLLNWQGLQGFLPASQLKTEHYPRVTDGDKMKILEELRKLVGEKIVVSVIGATPDDGKLVFSEKDVEKAFERFENKGYSDIEKIKFTRDLLRKVFSAFTSGKLMSSGLKLKIKEKKEDWFLKKHISTKERFDYYPELYEKLLKDYKNKKNLNIFDFGAGINGFSYSYLKKINKNINYIGVESIGQFVELMNSYFKEKEFDKKAKAFQISLFDLNSIKKILKEHNKNKVVFLFKTLDSLEMIERDYSKKLLSEIGLLADRIVVSFATKSLVKKKNFFVNRNWFYSFIKDNFKILDDFEIGSERYVVLAQE